MTSGDNANPGHAAARAARPLIEEVLFALSELPARFDREGLRDRLLRAIELLYVVLDAPVVALVQFDGLNQAAAVAAECRALLARDGEVDAPRALENLGAAAAGLRSGAEEVAKIQLGRRAEMVFGALDAPLPAARPFRAGRGMPALHAFTRRPLAPYVPIEPGVEALAEARSAVPTPRTLEELAAFAEAAASGALERRFAAGDRAAPPVEPPVLPAFEPAVEEVEVVRRLARDCLEDIANLRNLRKPNALETWLDQAPFEQRLIDNLDAFAALGGAALPCASLFHAEAKTPDPERAFAVALALGSVDGRDTVGAAVMTLKQSAPETYPGWVEGLRLAPNPAVDAAMADLAVSSRPELAALALDVLHARGTLDETVTALLDRAEPPIARRIARALATSLPRSEAIDLLDRMSAATADDETFLAAVESLLRRGHAPALDLLRRTLAASPSTARGEGALQLLCVVGRASDLDRLLSAANAAPTVRLVRGLGRFGHVDSLGALVNLLDLGDDELAAAAAEALERITGAGLYETIEEPWEVELPPEVEGAGAIPVPMRKVRRVVADPTRWSTWVRNNQRRLDIEVKTRGGVPFTPMQIVAELEAAMTPAERREEAARELALLTGVSSLFSPHDWVARQKQLLAELRVRVAAVSAAPGAWSLAAPQRPPLRPAVDVPPTSAPISDATTTAPLPPVVLVEPALPFKPADDLAGTVVPDLSPELRARLAASVLPFQPSAPADDEESRATLPTPELPSSPARAPAPSPPALSLEQYAALGAELAASPAHAGRVLARYGLAGAGEWRKLDEAWQERLRRAPVEHQQWQARRRHYLGYWHERQAKGPR